MMDGSRAIMEVPVQRERFWERFALEALTRDEWEALCDGCGRCCLLKLQDEEDGTVYFTDLACQYLDGHECNCRAYAERFERVPDCLQVTPALARNCDWLPHTCTYRRLARGQGLPSWHPLVTGDQLSVHRAGVSVRGRTRSEAEVAERDYEEHIVRWV